MEKTFVNILGGNASGKSTRVTCLVKFLGEKFGEPELVFHHSMKTKKDAEVGRIYKTSIGNMFILGRFNKKGKWVGLDTADFSTYDSRYAFIKYMFDNYDISYFIQEGYFNNRGYAFTLEKVLDNGAKVDKTIEFFFLYEDVKDFQRRTNERTGKDRDLDWAENAPGWRDNLTQTRVFNELKESETKTVLEKVSIDVPRDYFVEYFFGENFNCEEEPKKESDNSILEDW
jgi:energy-coupling factor transporter ATP-binding protein EcfA2